MERTITNYFMNTLNTQKPSIVACFLRIFFGALCCFGFVLKILELLNGSSEPLKLSSIFSGLIGVVLIGRGINGILLYREDRPLPKSFSFYVWLIIGLPVLVSLWTIMLAVIDIASFWPYLLSIFPVGMGIMAITSVYEGKGDAFYLIKCFVIMYALGIPLALVELLPGPTIPSIISTTFRVAVTCFSLLFLYKAKAISVALPESERNETKIGKWITIVYAGLMFLFTILGLIGTYMG